MGRLYECPATAASEEPPNNANMRKTKLEELDALRAYADDPEFQARWREVKLANK